jgi:hypothetical protein
MTKRRDRNRKRSQRRAIYCPTHGTYLDSASAKHMLFADKPEHLRQRGVNRRAALTLIQSRTAVPIPGEWLEAFWCNECQETRWYHVCKESPSDTHSRPRYHLSVAPEALWRQASGVIEATGNPSVSEFTRRVARAGGYHGVRGFRYL